MKTHCIGAACLFVLGIMLCACTTTTTIRPNNLALSNNDIDGGDSGERLHDMAAADLLKRGNSLLSQGNLEMAHLYFVTAVGREPENPLPHIGLGDIEFRKGHDQAALASYQKAAVLDSQNLEAVLGQIQILRGQGNPVATQEQINRAIQIAPNDIRVLTELATTYNLQGQETLAAPLFKEIAGKAPDAAAAFNNIGVNELSLGNYAFAIVNLSKAHMIDGKNEKFVNNLAMAFALYGQEDQALKLYTKTIGEAAAWNNIGYLYMTRGRYDDAERTLRKALELNPKFYSKAQENLDRLKKMRTSDSASVSGK